MIRGALGSRYGIQGALGRSVKRAAAGGGWWDLNGTITSCVAAYQPKGAASYAASLTDLSGNSNDATEGAAPNWDATNGWVFLGSHYLKTGVVPNGGSYSAIVRYSGASVLANRLFGAESGAVRFFIIPNYNSLVFYANGPTVTIAPALVSGVLTIAGDKGYRDGSYDGDIGAYSGTISQDVYIGATNDDGSAARLIVANIQAFAIYNAVLTSTQVADLTTAMAAL